MSNQNNISDEFVVDMSDDVQIREQDRMNVNESQLEHKWYHNLKYLLVGIAFGIVFIKAEIISWFRIQEMFRFQSFHMYGVIGSAVVIGALSVWLIRKFNIKTIYNEEIIIHPKTFNKGQVIGGLLFGVGWAITGACPGPLFALIGSGATVIIVTLISAIAGTWVYGYFRERLPH
ncbi:MAG: YeeE/YedE family protein [Saprospiraceae bacterium]|nr:YeeE/YedE family protein [Saprospiraceae bacterium]